MSRNRLIKVEGAGNDFILGVGDWAERLRDPTLARRLCDRRRGIGADGVLSLTAARNEPSVTLDCLNADGSTALFCGNATRCAARVAVDLLGMQPSHLVRTAWHEIPALVEGGQVRLSLPPPSEPPRSLELDTSTGSFHGEFVDFGVPHLVVRCDEVAALDLESIAPGLRSHPDLGPAGSNVSFVARQNEGAIAIRTWERGVEGETLCCGSASTVSGLLEMAATGRRSVTVVPISGDRMLVETDGRAPACACRLTGPARIVAEIQPSEEWLRDSA